MGRRVHKDKQLRRRGSALEHARSPCRSRRKGGDPTESQGTTRVDHPRRGLPGRQHTCATCPVERGDVCTAISGETCYIRQATSKAARRGAEWGPVGLRGTWWSMRGGSPPCLTGRRLRGCPAVGCVGRRHQGKSFGG